MSVSLILDYSGTVCTEAPRLAIPENLDKALQSSGLKTMGMDVFAYWNKVVLPYWDIAKKGEISLLECIERAAIHRISGGYTISAKKFVKIFMSMLYPHMLWEKAIRSFIENSIRIVIATEHYKEAAEAIESYLIERNIISAIYPHKAPCTIVCSSNIGEAKDSGVFWDAVKDAAEGAERLIYVDDFNLNEAEFLSGKDIDKKTHLEKMLKNSSRFLTIMGAKEIDIFPFVLENIFADKGELEKELATKIRQIENAVYV
ncbi:hypothetical protein WKV44_06360 [Spirochaetia bacterium 38H-sp]|uniref:HAD family hydrolase n=1 Tax=Rarispira pelagica TaxID=3141764 RepID=A0ABU9UDY4_9SPIR